VGAAGVGSSEEREMVQSVLHKAFHNTHVYVHHDAYIAQYGAFGGGAGVIVTSGTGSIAYGRNADGEEARAGGWGWLLGDEGSGWWIAREAVRCALAQWEGSGPTTGITDLLIEHFQVADAYQLVPAIYSETISRDDLTTLGQQLADLAREGDEIAAGLYHRAGKELAELALRTGNKLNIATDELEVALLGGVGNGALDLLRPGMTAAWEAASESEGSDLPSLVEPQMDAVRGAVLWARESIVRRSYA
ncbi:MAG TPA: hypothetical protein ENH10_05520, partial [Bacteroidetes bacterium]|nr:hypothetical protein [Bacteroidota bacterium]HEX04603.1 hypothetical protein [Bacteroidota bacterium]